MGFCSSPRGSQSHQGTFHRSWWEGVTLGLPATPTPPQGLGREPPAEARSALSAPGLGQGV